MSKHVAIYGPAKQAHYVLEVMAEELDREDIVYIINAEEQLTGRYFDHLFHLKPIGAFTLGNLQRHGTVVMPIRIEGGEQ